MKLFVELTCIDCGVKFVESVTNVSDLQTVSCPSCAKKEQDKQARKQRVLEKNNKKKKVLTELETFTVEERLRLIEEELYNLKHKKQLFGMFDFVPKDMPEMINNTRSM